MIHPYWKSDTFEAKKLKLNIESIKEAIDSFCGKDF